MSLKFALMGCGRIARKHAEILSGHFVRNAELAAVCDCDFARAAAFGEKYKVPAYPSLEEMVKAHPEIDVVNVLTPSGLHAEHAIRAANLGKHVVVEKPMALRLSDADEMNRVCDRNGVRLFVVKQNRFNLAVQKLHEALVAGRFGKIVCGTVRVRWCRTQEYYDHDAWRGTWAYDGGVFSNQASHHIDLLEWMLGTPVSVYATTRTALAHIETEDTGFALIHFESGAIGCVEATTAVRPKDLEGSLSILGEKGSVVIGGFAVNQIQTWNFTEKLPSDDTVIQDTLQTPPNVYGFGHIPYLENVVDCILNKKHALVDGIEGYRSLELISAMYESSETGREVRMKYFPEKCRLGMR